MILGIGNDLIEIARIRKIIDSTAGAKFLARILTLTEQKLAEERNLRKYEFTAGRFAVKEAVVKALGCGIGEQVGFQDMQILPDHRGRPVCYIEDAALKRLNLNSNIKVHISISHSETTAAAFAVIEM